MAMIDVDGTRSVLIKRSRPTLAMALIWWQHHKNHDCYY